MTHSVNLAHKYLRNSGRRYICELYLNLGNSRKSVMRYDLFYTRKAPRPFINMFTQDLSNQIRIKLHDIL